MASLNSFNFTGRLGADPELRTTSSGVSVCKLSVAVDPYKKDGDTIWVSVSVWREQGENCARFLAKGREVAINGEVSEVRAFERRNGDPGASLEITARSVTFIGSRGDDDGARQSSGSSGATSSQPADEDDDIPF